MMVEEKKNEQRTKEEETKEEGIFFEIERKCHNENKKENTPQCLVSGGWRNKNNTIKKISQATNLSPAPFSFTSFFLSLSLLDLLALWSFERNPFKIQTTLSMWAAVFSFFHFCDVKWVWQIIPQQISQEWWWSNRKFSFNGKKVWGYCQKSRKLAQEKRKEKKKLSYTVKIWRKFTRHTAAPGWGLECAQEPLVFAPPPKEDEILPHFTKNKNTDEQP